MEKRKIRLLSSAAAAAALFAFGGCTVIKEFPSPKTEIAKVTPEEHELARKLLHAFVADDAAAFVALLPEEMRTNFNEEMFKKTRKSLFESVGTPISFKFITSLELPSLTPQIWKVRFKRVNRRGEEYTSELMFRVITGKINKKTPVITAFQFL